MAKHMIAQKTVIVPEDKLNLGTIVNQALIDILIAKQIISEEELLNSIGMISSQEVSLVKGES
jgi:hypothetical protein